MPRTQIDDHLQFTASDVFAAGTLETVPTETMKTLLVRVCQRLQHDDPICVAEGSLPGPFTASGGRWTLTLTIVKGTPQEGPASASAVLVFEEDDDLFALAWSECAHLVP